MTATNLPRQMALDHIRRCIDFGLTLDRVLALQSAQASPPRDGKPSTWVSLSFGYVWPSLDSAKGIKLKQGQIGVACYWKDGRAEHGVFSIKELWDEIVNPLPVQLELFALEAVS